MATSTLLERRPSTPSIKEISVMMMVFVLQII
jgi:hypothetical protein